MRRPHLLRSNASSQSVQAALWFDTETVPCPAGERGIYHRLLFGWAAYARRRSNGQWTKLRWYRFDTRAGFRAIVDSVVRKKVKTILACHNTGFDLPVLDMISGLAEDGWKLSMCVIDAPPTLMLWRRNGCALQIIDTLNYWRSPLKDLGRSIGLPKLDMPDGWMDREVADRYCKRDVEIIARMCQRWWDFLQLNDLGGAAMTLAGQSLRTFRHRFMKHEIFIDNHERSLALARAAYHGGRVECFFIGHFERDMNLLDVHSMYPSVMASHNFPVKLVSYLKHARPDEVLNWLSGMAVVADVSMMARVNRYPVVHDGRLVFPTGSLRCALCGPELAAAIESGEVTQIHACALYETAPIFKDFVLTIYAERLCAKSSGDELAAYSWKILMNSLYGKFGQSGFVWNTTDVAEDISARSWIEVDAHTGRVTRYRQLGGILQTRGEESESRDSMPAIAAYVTAYARDRLWHLIQKAGPGQCYYVDTDSLLVTRAGFEALMGEMHPTELGKLGLEMTCHEGEIYGPKDYRFGEKVRIKGVRSSAVWVGPNTVEQDQWSGLGAYLLRSREPGPTTHTVTKTLRRTYDKGVRLPDGTVQPLHMAPGVVLGLIPEPPAPGQDRPPDYWADPGAGCQKRSE